MGLNSEGARLWSWWVGECNRRLDNEDLIDMGVFSHNIGSNNLARTSEDDANVLILNMLIRWF